MIPFSTVLLATAFALPGGHDDRPAATFPMVPVPRPCAVCGFANSLGFVHTLAPLGPQAGQGAVSLRHELQSFDRYSDAELLAHSTGGVEAHSYDRRQAARLGGIYGLTDRVAVGVDVPYVWNTNLREADVGAPPGIEDGGSQQGLGDSSLYLQWTASRDDATRDASGFSVLAGAKLPTGDTQQNNPAGDRLEADHQLGSGSVDPMLGASFGSTSGGFFFGLSCLYTIAMDGSQDSNLGDVVRTSFGLGTEVSTIERNGAALRLVLEFGNEHRQHAEIAGTVDENTGGDQWFVSPGVRATFASGWTCFGSVSIPIEEDLDGEQAATRFRTAFGVALAF